MYWKVAIFILTQKWWKTVRWGIFIFYSGYHFEVISWDLCILLDFNGIFVTSLYTWRNAIHNYHICHVITSLKNANAIGTHNFFRDQLIGVVFFCPLPSFILDKRDDWLILRPQDYSDALLYFNKQTRKLILFIFIFSSCLVIITIIKG